MYTEQFQSVCVSVCVFMYNNTFEFIFTPVCWGGKKYLILFSLLFVDVGERKYI